MGRQYILWKYYGEGRSTFSKYDFDEHTKALIGEHIVGKIDFNRKTGAIVFQICVMLRVNNDKMHYVGLARFKGNILRISNVVEVTNQSERFDFIRFIRMDHR